MNSELMIGGMTLYEVFWYFLTYSLIGWAVEVVYHAVTQGKVINRGFLAGPVCPVYGFGMLIVFGVIDAVGGTTVDHIADAHGVVIFFCGMILASLVEFIGGWGLYHAFHARWWDYSKKPFNLGGYVCLEFSIYWGLGALLVVRILHPVVHHASAGLIPEKWGWPLIAFLYVVYAADFVVTVMIVMGLNKRLAELDKLRASMSVVSNDLSEKIGTQTLESMQRLDEGRVKASLAKAELRDTVGEKRTEAEQALARQKQKAAQTFSNVEQRAEQMRESTSAALENAKTAAKASMEARSEANALKRKETEERIRELRKAMTSGPVFGPLRILKAFPDMKYDSEVYESIMKEIREEIYGN